MRASWAKRWASVGAIGLAVAGGMTSDARGQAADPNRAANAAVDVAGVAPYVDENTAAIVRIEPGRINIDEGLAFLKRVLPPDAALDPGSIGGAAGLLAQWKASGAKEGYLVVNVLRPASPPLFVIPLPDGTDDRDLKFLLKMSPWNQIERKPGALVAGDAKSIESLKSLAPKRRAELEAALQSLGPATVAAAAALTPDQRRVLRETLPPAPPEFGGPEANQYFDELEWIAVALDAPPTFSARLAAKARTPEAAEKIASLATRALDRGATLLEKQEDFPDAAKFAQLFRPRAERDLVTWGIAEGDEAFRQLQTLIRGPLGQARTAAKRAESMNHLKQIGLACHTYSDANRTFPPAASLGPNGKRLLSWRVHILPFIEENELYRQFKLDEPWDSEHNKKLIAKMPRIYRHPASKLPADAYKTNYVAPVGPDAILSDKPPAEGAGPGVPTSAVTDGLSTTILALEVPDERAVVWTQPDDWNVDLNRPLQGLGGPFEGGFIVLFGDGAVRFVANSIDPKTFAAMLTRSGGEVVKFE